MCNSNVQLYLFSYISKTEIQRNRDLSSTDAQISIQNSHVDVKDLGQYLLPCKVQHSKEARFGSKAGTWIHVLIWSAYILSRSNALPTPVNICVKSNFHYNRVTYWTYSSEQFNAVISGVGCLLDFLPVSCPSTIQWGNREILTLAPNSWTF